MSESPTHPSLQSAGFVLARNQGEHGYEFLLLRNATHGNWGFPKGTLEPGETPRQAAWRELAEETGLNQEMLQVIPDAEKTISYTVPANTWGAGNPPNPTPKRATYYLAILNPTAPPLIITNEHSDSNWLPLKEATTQLAATPQLATLLESLATKLPAM